MIPAKRKTLPNRWWEPYVNAERLKIMKVLQREGGKRMDFKVQAFPTLHATVEVHAELRRVRNMVKRRHSMPTARHCQLNAIGAGSGSFLLLNDSARPL